MSDELTQEPVAPADDSTADEPADAGDSTADEPAADDVVVDEDEAEVADDALAVEDVADLLAGAVISGSTQASEAAIAEYEKLGREPVLGGPIKVEVPVDDTAPTSELEAEQAAKAAAADEDDGA